MLYLNSVWRNRQNVVLLSKATLSPKKTDTKCYVSLHNPDILIETSLLWFDEVYPSFSYNTPVS